MIKHITLLGICLALSACAEMDTDFRALESGVNQAPEPKAIVGMWQRVGVNDYVDVRDSKLFRSDGTGLHKSRHRFTGSYSAPSNSQGPRDYDNPATPFRWRYEGDGSWSTTIDNPQARYRIAGDALLYFLDDSGVKIRHVYKRSN